MGMKITTSASHPNDVSRFGEDGIDWVVDLLGGVVWLRDFAFEGLS